MCLHVFVLLAFSWRPGKLAVHVSRKEPSTNWFSTDPSCR